MSQMRVDLTETSQSQVSNNNNNNVTSPRVTESISSSPNTSLETREISNFETEVQKLISEAIELEKEFEQSKSKLLDLYTQIGKIYNCGDINLSQSIKENINYAEALEWFTKAANQGFATAEYNLGAAHFFGKTEGKVAKAENINYTIALEWLTKAANQGFAEAEYNLGMAHYCGKTEGKVTKTENVNIPLAFKFWRAIKQIDLKKIPQRNTLVPPNILANILAYEYNCQLLQCSFEDQLKKNLSLDEEKKLARGLVKYDAFYTDEQKAVFLDQMITKNPSLLGDLLPFMSLGLKQALLFNSPSHVVQTIMKGSIYQALLSDPNPKNFLIQLCDKVFPFFEDASQKTPQFDATYEKYLKPFESMYQDYLNHFVDEEDFLVFGQLKAIYEGRREEEVPLNAKKFKAEKD